MHCLVHPKLSAAILKKAKSPTLAACTLLFVSQLFQKGADKKNPERYWPLQSRISRKIYTSRFYGPMLALLYSLHALETFRGGSYLAGKVSIQYRLARRYATGVHAIEVNCPRLEARWDRLMTSSSYAAMSGSARKWILATYRKLTFAPEIEARLAAHPFKSADASAGTRHHIENITEHRARFFVCPRSGRVYYPVANLPKKLRALLLIEGEPVTELDLAASQPTLLATLFPSACPEKLAYLDFVRSGNFYEDIGAWAGQGWTRDEAKTEFFNQIAYGSYYNAHKYPLLPVFRKRFPKLVGLMEAIKRHGNQMLPLRMQKLEATIAVYGACGECAQRQIPVLPVHDSLICRRRDAEQVAEIFSRHWLTETGIPARLKALEPAT